jgi:Ulp1 family protease
MKEEIFTMIIKETIEEVINKNKELFDLSDIDEQMVNKIFCERDKNKLIVKHFNIDMTVSKILCLKGSQWLNDEVINFYIKLLESRNNSNKNYPKCYYFNTFFYQKLTQNNSFNYQNVKRWTKNIDLFSFDKILIPVHLGI